MELVNPALWSSSDRTITEGFAHIEFANPEANFSCESHTKLVDTDSRIGHLGQVWLFLFPPNSCSSEFLKRTSPCTRQFPQRGRMFLQQ